MKLLQRIFPLLTLLALVTLNGASNAAEVTGNKHFRFSGFATLGLTKSGDETLGFHRDLDQAGLYDGDWSVAADSLLGLQMDFAVSDQFGGAVQLVGKDRIVDSLENSVEWAFLRYRLNPDWTIRAGRIGFDLFMLSDYRSVGFAYLWTRPPVEFYAPLTFTGFDGADLTWSTDMAGGMLRAKVSFGDTKSTLSILGNLVEIKANDIVAGTLSWESERWQLKISTSDTKLGEKDAYFPGSEPLADVLKLALPIWPEAADVLDDLYVSNQHISYYALGAAYTNNPWQIQTEISWTDPKVDLYPATLQGYFSTGYQIQSFTPFVMVSHSETLEDTKQVPAAPVIPSAPLITAQLALLHQGVQTIYDAITTEQTTLTAGVRWDIRYDVALKIQLDHSWVDQKGFSLWNIRSIPAEDKEINTFSINLNCIF